MKVEVTIHTERAGESPGFREEVDYEVTIKAEVDVSIHHDVYGTGDSPSEAECDVLRVWVDGEEMGPEDLSDYELDLVQQEAWEIFAEAQRDGAEYDRGEW